MLDVNGETIVAKKSKLRVFAKLKTDELNVSQAKSSVNEDLSKFMDESVRLVFMDRLTQRTTDKKWSNSDLSLADNMPISVINTASFDELTKAVGRDISIAQFRPNLVIHSNLPWAEDGWKSIRIGEAVLDLIHPISRCKIVTLDPETGEQDHSAVMRSLINNRRSGDSRVKGVLFGWAAIAKYPSIVNIDDPVEILEKCAPWPVRP